MNRQSIRKLGVSATGAALATLLCCSTTAMAADSDWEFEGTVYLWGAQMDIETPRGHSVELPFYKILDTLQFALMGAFEARKDKWSVGSDVVYMNLEQEGNRDTRVPDPQDTKVKGSVGMKAWIVTPTVGYAVHDSEKARVEIIGGARYLWMNASVKASVGGQDVFDESASKDYWDGIVGMRATINLNEKWYMPLYADIGTGTSDGTWQGMAGVGYRFSKFNTSLVYRYLDYSFDDNPAMSSLVTKGVMGTVSFTF